MYLCMGFDLGRGARLDPMCRLYVGRRWMGAPTKKDKHGKVTGGQRRNLRMLENQRPCMIQAGS